MDVMFCQLAPANLSTYKPTVASESAAMVPSVARQGNRVTSSGCQAWGPKSTAESACRRLGGREVLRGVSAASRRRGGPVAKIPSSRQPSPRNRQTVPTRAEQVERLSVYAHVLGGDVGPLTRAPLGAAAGRGAEAAGPGARTGEHLLPGAPRIVAEEHHEPAGEAGAVLGIIGSGVEHEREHELLEAGVPAHPAPRREPLSHLVDDLGGR